MIRRLLTVFILLVMASALQAQSGLSSFGRDFYFAYKRTSFDCTTVQPYQSYWILISSLYDCNASISYFDYQTGQEHTDRTVHLVSKTALQLPINTGYTEPISTQTGKPVNPDGEVPEYTAIHVRADRPVSVSYFSTGPDDCAMYLALPTPVLGKRYVVSAPPNNNATGSAPQPRFCNTNGEPSSSYFAVIGIKDGTSVKIRPTGTTRKGFPGATSGPNNGNGKPNDINITLNRGQVYHVKSEIKTSPAYNTIDMSGSQIEADQPVAVIAGCENAFIGTATDTQDDQRNLTCQMMVPLDYWQSSGYLAMPLF